MCIIILNVGSVSDGVRIHRVQKLAPDQARFWFRQRFANTSRLLGTNVLSTGRRRTPPPSIPAPISDSRTAVASGSSENSCNACRLASELQQTFDCPNDVHFCCSGRQFRVTFRDEAPAEFSLMIRNRLPSGAISQLIGARTVTRRAVPPLR